jgi:hypothetical protein
VYLPQFAYYFTSLTDDQLKALYTQTCQDLIASGGIQITSGNGGDSGFSGVATLNPLDLLYNLGLEMWRRGFIPNKPIRRTRAIFRDPVGAW